MFDRQGRSRWTSYHAGARLFDLWQNCNRGLRRSSARVLWTTRWITGGRCVNM